jgi:hypothetical protein
MSRRPPLPLHNTRAFIRNQRRMQAELAPGMPFTAD